MESALGGHTAISLYRALGAEEWSGAGLNNTGLTTGLSIFVSAFGCFFLLGKCEMSTYTTFFH